MLGETINWSPGVTLEMIEKQAILLAFRFYRGNKTATANSLGIAIRTLDNKLEKYEADGKAQNEAEDYERRKQEQFLARARGIQPADTISPTPVPKSVHGAHSGLGMESIANASEKQSVPVPEREKVQSVLPQQTTSSGTGKRR